MAALAPGLTGPALADETPPLWANLAECSAVFASVAAARDAYGGAPDVDIARAEDVSQAFLARAETAAGEAGRTDPRADIVSVMTYLTPRWENRIGLLFSTKSNLDWIKYCGNLGRAEGVLPLQD